MAGYFLGLEFPDTTLNSLKKLRRPVEGVSWYGASAFVQRGWDEWGLLPLCDLQGSQEEVDALDLRLQQVKAPAFTVSMRALTFWVAEAVTDICLKVVVHPALERLVAACLEAAADAGMEASAFEPLVCLGQARNVPREAL